MNSSPPQLGSKQSAGKIDQASGGGTADNKSSPGGTQRATLFLIMATFGFSLLPLVFGLSNSKSNPALSTILFWSGTIIVMSVLLKTISKREKVKLFDLFPFLFLKEEKKWKISDSDANTTKRLWNKYALLFVIAGGFNWLFFAWSLNYLDVAVASIIGEIWLVGFVLLRYYFSKKGKIKILNSSTLILFLFALFGVIYINLSHNSINLSFDIYGLILITIFIMLSSIMAERSLYWAETMAKEWGGGG